MNVPVDRLEAPRLALCDAAQAHAAAPHDLGVLESLCRAAVAYAEARGTAPRPAPAPTGANPAGDPGRVLVPFGRNQGEYLADVNDRDLHWLREAVEKSVDDPAKARWRVKNQELLDAIDTVLQRRRRRKP